MTLRAIQRALFLCAIFVLGAVPAAQAQTRAVAGDNHDAAIVIPINGSKTVKNIQNATAEEGIYDIVSCDGAMDTTHSVWFKFTLPDYAILDLDSGGSLITLGDRMSTDVTITLFQHYDVDDSVAEVGCAAGPGARLTDQSIPDGDYLVRIARNNFSSGPITSASQYRLSIRARYYQQLLKDPRFDQNPLGVVWKVKKAGNPPQISLEGDPVHVRFDGVAKGQIAQTAKIASSKLKVKAGDLLTAVAVIQGTELAGADVKVMLTITYSDGTPSSKASVTTHVVNTDTTLGGMSTEVSAFAEITSKAVKSATVTIVSPTVNDTFNVILTYLRMYAGTSVRADGVLPVPPPSN